LDEWGRSFLGADEFLKILLEFSSGDPTSLELIFADHSAKQIDNWLEWKEKCK
jgi:hypothetical protein